MSTLPPTSAWSRFGLIFLGIGLVLVLGMLWLVNRLHDGSHRTDAHQPASATPRAPGNAAKPPPVDQAGARPAAAEQIGQAIADALAALRDPAVKDKRAALQALREALAKVDPAVAIAAIRQFLAGKEDAPTGLPFRVGPKGVLADAPSLRTFLMDQLGSLSTRAGTTDAAEVGREILADKTSPDEWAVALRNVAWADPQGSKAFLADKARELIQYTPWQSLHSRGYLEAFDAAAYSGDASLLDQLAPLAHDPSPVQHAALVTMDRLSAVAPDQVAGYLNTHPDLLAGNPLIRADYMGKVDLGDPDQVEQAETYLQRSDVSMEEKSKFLARLGVPAGFVSYNLLTPPQAQAVNLTEHRILVNQTATSWLNSGQFPALQGQLQQLVNNTAPGG